MMDNSLCIEAAVGYLTHAQAADGSFAGYSSDIPTDFSKSLSHPCDFIGSIIAVALEGCDSARKIRRHYATYIERQSSADGTWQYWRSGTKISHLYPLPNDLDDTAYAIMALRASHSDGVTGEHWAQFARALISAEAAVGGPYRTWLLYPASPPWDDIDLVVNSNLARTLALEGVVVPGIVEFIERALVRGRCVSPYYCGEAFALYSISHWYRGEQLSVLRRMIAAGLRTAPAGDPLTYALLLSAARLVGEDTTPLYRDMRQRLIDMQLGNGSWRAVGLMSISYGGERRFVGSEALTTALCIEALAIVPTTTPPSTGDVPPRGAEWIRRFTSDQVRQLEKEFGEMISATMVKLLARSSSDQITELPHLIAQAYAIELPEKRNRALVLASAFGWAAYTLYDDIWDEDSTAEWLGVANFCLRVSRDQFRDAAVNKSAFQHTVTAAFNTIDAANTWEFLHTRINISQNVDIADLPAYGDLDQLAQRSWGHAMTALGVVLEIDDRSQDALLRFFHHFLIARQLNDDAHDWEADLVAGKVTAVGEILLRGYARHLNLEKVTVEVGALRPFFWGHTIDVVSGLIIRHCELASQALAGSLAQIPGRTSLEAMLTPLHNGAQAALIQKNQTQAFIQTYISD